MRRISFGLFVLISVFMLGACGMPSGAETKVSPATKAPKSQKIPTATSAAKTGGDDFSLDSAVTVAPDNILEEVAYFGTGGPAVCEPDSPLFISAPKSAQVFQKAVVQTCGWELNENISVEITEPGGQVERDDVIATGLFGGSEPTLRYPFYPAQAGQYKIIFIGSKGQLSANLDVVRPGSPQMYMVQGKQIVFYNLQPHEAVSLYAYAAHPEQQIMKLAGWKSYQADESGNISISIEDSQLYYFAFGENAGFLKDGNRTGSGTNGTIFK